jgi:hypothetical protein
LLVEPGGLAGDLASTIAWRSMSCHVAAAAAPVARIEQVRAGEPIERSSLRDANRKIA